MTSTQPATRSAQKVITAESLPTKPLQFVGNQKPQLTLTIKAAAARLAKEDGVSLNQWIASAVAQKVGAVETAADFFRRRAGNAQPEDLNDLLARVPDRAPDPGDERLYSGRTDQPASSEAAAIAR